MTISDVCTTQGALEQKFQEDNLSYEKPKISGGDHLGFANIPACLAFWDAQTHSSAAGTSAGPPSPQAASALMGILLKWVHLLVSNESTSLNLKWAAVLF